MKTFSLATKFLSRSPGPSLISAQRMWHCSLLLTTWVWPGINGFLNGEERICFSSEHWKRFWTRNSLKRVTYLFSYREIRASNGFTFVKGCDLMKGSSLIRDCRIPLSTGAVSTFTFQYFQETSLLPLLLCFRYLLLFSQLYRLVVIFSYRPGVYKCWIGESFAKL